MLEISLLVPPRDTEDSPRKPGRPEKLKHQGEAEEGSRGKAAAKLLKKSRSRPSKCLVKRLGLLKTT